MFSKDDLFTGKLKREKCPLHISKNVIIKSTWGSWGGCGWKWARNTKKLLRNSLASPQNPSIPPIVRCFSTAWGFLNLSKPCAVNSCCIPWRLSPGVHLWDSFCEPAVLLSIASPRPLTAKLSSTLPYHLGENTQVFQEELFPHNGVKLQFIFFLLPTTNLISVTKCHGVQFLFTGKGAFLHNHLH